MRYSNVFWGIACISILLMFTACTSWNKYVLNDGWQDQGRFASLDLGTNEEPHISFSTRWNPDGDHVRALRYAQYGESGFTSQTVVESPPMRIRDTAIAVDHLGRIHIAYTDSNESNLLYARKENNSWHFEAIATTGFVGHDISIAVDSQGDPHVSFGTGYVGATEPSLRYAKKVGLGWAIDIVDLEPGSYTSVAVDNQDRPHISYTDWGHLKYARLEDDSWVVEFVTTEGDQGFYSCLALDSLNRPHISYFDGTEDDLKYSYWTGTMWVTQILDFAGRVGHGTTIALDSNDRPHIAYLREISAADYTSELLYRYWTGSQWKTELVTTGEILSGFGHHMDLEIDSHDIPHLVYVKKFDDQDRLVYAYRDESPN